MPPRGTWDDVFLPHGGGRGGSRYRGPVVPLFRAFPTRSKSRYQFFVSYFFYIIAKSEFYLFIFKVALGDALIKIQIYDVISPEL
jgi:hypothetical protein